MSDTKIEWCTTSWNPITGCSPISEGCKNCYARQMANRFRGRFGYPKDDPFKVTFHRDKTEEPMKWKKPRLIFVCSMGDLFHKDIPDKWIDDVFDAMAVAPQHTYLVLTKRPERMLQHFEVSKNKGLAAPYWMRRQVLLKVWFGVTAENQQRACERIPELVRIPAAGHFISVEPMLEQVRIPNEYLAWLDWVICGGESGPGARPIKDVWVHDLRENCRDANVPFFFKQWGGSSKKESGHLLNGEEVREVPESLKPYFIKG